jgi:hypothetical protein
VQVGHDDPEVARLETGIPARDGEVEVRLVDGEHGRAVRSFAQQRRGCDLPTCSRLVANDHAATEDSLERLREQACKGVRAAARRIADDDLQRLVALSARDSGHGCRHDCRTERSGEVAAVHRDTSH